MLGVEDAGTLCGATVVDGAGEVAGGAVEVVEATEARSARADRWAVVEHPARSALALSATKTKIVWAIMRTGAWRTESAPSSSVPRSEPIIGHLRWS